jgi:hypothetical protein
MVRRLSLFHHERVKVRITKWDTKLFTSEDIGRYIAEHDSVDNSLRLSWSGDQLFMSEDEACALLAFLQQLYSFEDTIHYETDYSYLERMDAAWHV